MISRRDWQIQQFGIIKWSLWRPTIFQGEISIFLPEHIRLVMIAEKLPKLNNPLIIDVLRSIKISRDQVLQLTPDRVSILVSNIRCNVWILGKIVKFNISLKDSLKGAFLLSPTLEVLQTNSDARRDLWKQICKYKNDFFPHNI